MKLSLIAALPQVIDPQKQSIGPHEVKQSRERYLHRLNETASLTDQLFPEGIKLDKNMDASSYRQTAMLITHYAPVIEQHIERRIMCFFLQLAICFRTGLHFEIGVTSHQGDSAKALMLKEAGKAESKLCARNAAHSSTIPCLIASNAKEWNKSQENAEHRIRKFVYIKDSDIYHVTNATIDVPREINEADIAIDGKSTGSGLRVLAIDLLNKASKGKIRPEQGLSQFLDVIQGVVKEQIPKVKKEGVKACLNLYAENLSRVESNLSKTSIWADHILGLDLDYHPETTQIRPKIYELRYKAIQDLQFIQSELRQKIKSVSNKILCDSRKPPFFDDTFRENLFAHMKTQQNEIRLKNLFNFSPDTQDKGRRNATAKELIAQHSTDVKQLAKELENDFKQVKSQEQKLRGKVFAEIRNSKNLSLKQVVDLMHRQYPKSCIDKTKLSAIESGEKTMGEIFACRLCKVLRIDPVLFFPYFRYEGR
jgi:hypothetical protein